MKVRTTSFFAVSKELFYNYIADKGWDLYEVYIDVESGTQQRLIDDTMNKKSMLF